MFASTPGPFAYRGRAEHHLERHQDHDEVAQLYAVDAHRYDGYSGDRDGQQAIADWHEHLFDTRPDLTVDVSEVFASGLGPAALYTITAAVDDTPCTMRLGSVWDLDDQGLITDEYVYYDPDTVLTCGWAADNTP